MTVGDETTPLTLRDVTDRHGGQLSCGRESAIQQSFFRIEIPVAMAQEVGDGAGLAPVESRPEFHDFDLFHRAGEDRANDDTPLANLTYTLAMKRRERDFVALFNALWYRDFPVTPNHEDLGKRAVWTTHIASIVKQCADLMGLFTCFESGGRTDAVVQTAQRETWAKIEWEWIQPHSEKVNEFKKLASAANESELLVFIGYSRSDRHEENLRKIRESWRKIDTPLLVFLVTFSYHGKRRHFEQIQTHYFKNGIGKKLRQQPALPWHVEGTKWAALANPAVNTDAAR